MITRLMPSADIDRHERMAYAAAAISIAIGLAFVFVRAPHPWGWNGFDHYYELGLALARGEGFPTTDVPWGYAYFLAFFYRLAGDRPWVPLLAQVLLNGLVPVVLYRLVAPALGPRVAAVAALLAGAFSFNTVYASTQSSDAVCTVIFLASLLYFAHGLSSNHPAAFAASGLLAGIAPQFRPNLILFPVVLAAATLLTVRGSARRRIPGLAIYLTVAAALMLPWTIRNARLTGAFIPTSTHGGVQLWYGTLQTGEYLTSRAYNPRSVLEAPAFDYSSLSNQPLVVSAVRVPCGSPRADLPTLTYWTDRDADRRSVAPEPVPQDRGKPMTFLVPGQRMGTVVYYYFATPAEHGGTQFTPSRGPQDPFVFFVDDRHLEDLDRHDDLHDAFDVVRVVRWLAFHDGPPGARVDLNADGRVDEADLRRLVARLMNEEDDYTNPEVDVVTRLDVAGDAATLRLTDGSAFVVPRAWSGRITDVTATGSLAPKLCYARRRQAAPASMDPRDPCGDVEHVRVNDVFYRAEPHMMRRYTALAFDNITRGPVAFAAACLYRVGRLFVVAGTDDVHTAHQFEASGRVYRTATLASLSFAILGAAGILIALRRRERPWLLLLPIVYVPATICFVLTNMRYTVTVQPLLFAFVAVALTAAADALRRRPARDGGSPERHDPPGTRTAPRPS